MVILFIRLQIQDFYFYGSQQFLPFYGYKELEL